MTARSMGQVATLLCVLLAAYSGWHGNARGQTLPAPAPRAPEAAASPVTPPQHVHASGDEARCVACHEALPDGRLRSRFGERLLKPSSAWLGMAHDRDWIVRHRWVASDRGSLCGSCHQERDCTQCHDGRTRPRLIHPNDWLTLHRQQARRSATDCQGCHSLQTFCTECHARLGISQLAAPATRAGARIHPPAAQWTGSQNQHGREAQRSLATCVSCHAERDCVRCHGALPGGGSSPHPAGFSAKCGRLLAANPRACATCHGTDLTAVRGICRP